MMTILFASNLLFLSSVTVSLLSCYVESFNSDTTVTTGVTSLYKLCPYTNYCTKNKTKNQDNAEKSACCGNCSCEENCWKRGSCCPDKSNITVIQPLATCETVVVKRSPYVHPTSVEGNLYQRFFVTKSCPTKDDTLAEKCSGNLQSSLEDYVWVTDKTTNDIYNNKHCAICNGVKVFTPWKIKTDCTEALNGKKSPEAAVNFILDECGLTVESPSTEDHTDNVCLVPDISQCNVTGRWESHDLALETACNSFNQIYTKENLIATTRYRNVYCFLCNSPKGQVVSDICSYEYSSIKHGGVSFSGILDYKVFAKRVKETGGNGILEPHPVCAADEIKDPMQQRCLKLSCPLLQAPIYGRCVKLTTETIMLGVTAMFLFEPIWSKTNLVFEVWSDSEILAKKLLVKVHRQLDLSTRNCRPCRETVRVYDDNKMEQADIEKIPEKFSMYLLFETTKECQEAIIVARMSRLIGRELKLKFGREHITMMVSAASYEAYDFYQYKAGGKEIFLTHSYPCRTFHYADFQQLGRCPSVSLNITDYLHLMQMTNEASGERDINSLFGLTHIGDKIAGETENFTAQVCYKSYQSILKAKNHGITMLNIKVALVAMGLISTIFWA